jgi:HK97 family phage major capsid protein
MRNREFDEMQERITEIERELLSDECDPDSSRFDALQTEWGHLTNALRSGLTNTARWDIPNIPDNVEELIATIRRSERSTSTKRRQRLVKLSTVRGALEDGTSFPSHRTRSDTSLRGQALTANERADLLPDSVREHMAREIESDDDPEAMLARATIELSDRHYFRAFSKWMNDPQSGGHLWTEQEREAVVRVKRLGQVLQRAAMALGAGGTGGFLVPYELDPSILISSAGSVSPLRQISRVATTAQNEKRFVTSLGVTSSWDLEAEEVSDDSPALLQPAITCKKGAAFVQASFELVEDSDIAQQVGMLFADSKAVHENLSFTITQSQGPNGIISLDLAEAVDRPDRGA